MNKLRATEFVELALEALRDLEDAIRKNDQTTMNLKTEVLRQALFSMLEMIKLKTND